MHAAPPVRVELGRSLAWALAVALAWGAAAGNFAGWLLMQARWSVTGALVVGMVAALLAGWRGWQGQRPAILAWDGSTWRCDGAEGKVAVAIDAGDWMLLRVTGEPAGARWLPASRASALGPWAAWRAALFAARGDDAPAVGTI